jgi:hypothetical protein
MELAAEQLEARFGSLLKTVEVTLRSSQGWGKHADIDHDELLRFNEFFFPIIANHGEITSVIFAHESGREILLLMGEQGAGSTAYPIPQPGAGKPTGLPGTPTGRSKASPCTSVTTTRANARGSRVP